MSNQPVLYKQPSAWTLPSASTACVQIETYLRLGGASFQVRECSTNSKSPTGQLPAIEQGQDIGGMLHSSCPTSSSDQGVLGEFRAARLTIDFAKRHAVDLDQHLSDAQRAELLAYRTLIQTNLETATLFSAWCEPIGYTEIKKVMSPLPFPLNYIIPWSQSREVKKKYADLDASQIYSEAGDVITALGDRIRASQGAFFFGSRPCSLDALVFGHLLYYRLSPAAPPVLKEKVLHHTALSTYVEYIMREYFSTPALPAPPRTAPNTQGEETADAWGSSDWSDAAKGQKTKQRKTEPTEAEKSFKYYSRLWLIGTGAAMLGYVVMSGQYVKIVDVGSSLLEHGDDDDDDE
ncbi:hypothetical protein CEUSTIGMA_g2842.t1 [Chlamydomonas eustigma]|uniref:Metaxin n=1 Tax=Chlamydomonas eustigma TaxID=1157962 RepID=A0A250WX26_9CHLO|nr:hypothetical protein CEUSTIGMA_g2842.t1 [Chlamydomonas eustigma]|eukprot:GAX75398.1 hypothetical protein CEUSTIGMA_g2842.t1 [Chlamydomonas eustigma]